MPWRNSKIHGLENQNWSHSFSICTFFWRRLCQALSTVIKAHCQPASIPCSSFLLSVLSFLPAYHTYMGPRWLFKEGCGAHLISICLKITSLWVCFKLSLAQAWTFPSHSQPASQRGACLNVDLYSTTQITFSFSKLPKPNFDHNKPVYKDKPEKNHNLEVSFIKVNQNKKNSHLKNLGKNICF